MTKSFEQWLSWMESCHPVEIELGLERSQRTLQQLLTKPLDIPVITIAGTNGKGSTVAVLEALAIEDGKKPLVYTSPHFIDYRERLRFNGDWLTKEQHTEAFQAVETARGSTPLTYFEFATLAAIRCAEQLQPDLLILETGLGGRLDAVNVLAADIAIITTVDFDHQDWLGDDLESIAREKAGIIHKNKIAIIADPTFPKKILNEIKSTTEQLYIAEQEFKHLPQQQGWCWSNANYGPWTFDYLSFPFANVSAAIQAWSLFDSTHKLTEKFLGSALQNIKLSGRFETIATKPDVILDVAHNPQAFRTQLNLLNEQKFTAKTHIILGMLKDKNASDCIRILKETVDYWHIAELDTPRGSSITEMIQLLRHSEIAENKLQCYSSPVEAYNTVLKQASADDRIVITGSFYTVAPVLALFQERNQDNVKQ